MLHRFDQSRALAQNAIRESLEDICRRIDTADAVGRCEQVVTAFNGAQAATGPVTTLTVELPSTLAEARRKQGLVPVLLDGRGVPLYCETAAVEHRTGGTTSIRKQSGLQPGDYLSRTATEAFIRRQEGLQAGYYLCWPDIQPFDRFTVNAVCSIPALAYRTWRVGFAPLGRRTPLPRGVSPVRVQPRALAMENGRIRVQVAKDGCFHLYDKATRRWYQGLHVLEDSGEAGSGYWHRAPPGDRPFLSTSPAVRGAVAIRFRQTGSLAATCILRTAVRVPIGLTPADAWKRSLPDARIRRSRRRTALRVTTRLTLRAGERLLECRTTIRNTAACHRLRVLFPTRLASSHWFGDSAFDAVRRSIRVPDTTGWIEQAREEAPIRNFVAACDRRCGLAVVTRGLNEACVQDSAERAIAVTLFRSYSGYLFQWTRDSLLLGDLATEYALVPFTPRDGAPPPEVYAALDRYKVPVAAYSLPPGKGHLPAELRFFDIEGPLVLSAIKRPEDGNGIALRAFNPFERRIAARLRPGFACTQVWQANVNETPTRRLPAQRDGTVCIRLGPKQIVTLLWRGAGRPARR
jgi:hypothetical protein